MNKLKLFLLMSISFFCMAGYAQKKETMLRLEII